MSAEFDFIQWLMRRAKPVGLSVGIGDDLAALPWRTDDLLLVGADQMLDGVHFDSSVHCPSEIGAKAMNRNLSDCAAMACLPAAAVCTLALPIGCGEGYARELFMGMETAGAMFDCPVIGGDTGSWGGKLVISVTVLGRSAGIAPITRGGAAPGDWIYVTGPLGGSILGRHLSFTPRVALARTLAETGLISAMADLSDGLSRDLANLCRASGVGAVLEAGSIPIHPDVHRLPPSSATAIDHALNDGEDYELLLTSRSPIDHPGVIQIGRIVSGHAISLEAPDGTTELRPRGWQHEL